jgi:two-component system nitrogen regulation response regulator GlnG
LTPQQPVVLVIDDDRNMRWVMRNVLSDAGFEVAEAEAGGIGLEVAARCRPHTVLLDMRMPDLGGDEVLKRLRSFDPDLPVIIVTAHGSISSAVSVTREGAFDFITKPFRNEHLVATVQRAVARRPLVSPAPGARAAVAAIMGQGPSIQRLADQIEAVVSTDYSVVIYGETGAGKEVVARALHQHGRRSAHPLVVIDCGAIVESLIDSEFFGHEKGAFTGAGARRYGCFEVAAGGGTIFLDEVGNLPANGQKALLRTLEERTICRLGGTESIRLDLRVIAATNDDLKEQAKIGGFREDLLFRLAEYVITVPSLRARPEDIPFLARRFLTQAREALGRSPVEIAPAALGLLCAYRWPGNARELRNVMRRAALTAAKTITADDLADNLGDGALAATPALKPLDSASLRDRLRVQLRAVERDAVVSALDQAGGNKAEAARLLGIDYKTFRTKLKTLAERHGALVDGGR